MTLTVTLIWTRMLGRIKRVVTVSEVKRDMELNVGYRAEWLKTALGR